MSAKLKKIDVTNFMSTHTDMIEGVGKETLMIEKPKRGRRSTNRTIDKSGGVVVYLEKRQKEILKNSMPLTMQDIIRTSVELFLETYSDGNVINGEGISKVIAYIKETTK